jgi:diguanylate cyclase (GGDEF)-like protein
MALPMLSCAGALLVLVLQHGQWPGLVTGFGVATVAAGLSRMVLTVRQTQLLARAKVLANTDDLTGLPNRRALYAHAPAILAGGTTYPGSGSVAPADDRARTGGALLLVDLDRFKEVNDSLGHLVGDELLRQVGPRLAAQLRPQDMIARLGGDEFAVVLAPADPRPGEVARDAEDLAERLCRALDAPFVLDGITIHVSASLGLARHPEHGTTVTQLLQHADIAMYEAKQARASWSVYSPLSQESFEGRLRTVDELRTALESGARAELVLHYQPKLDLSSPIASASLVTGVEALVRWHHPSRGLVPPDQFLQLAEDYGLMWPLTQHVLTVALTQSAQWRRLGIPLPIAVNCSSSVLVDARLPGFVAGLLGELDLPGSALEIEITEALLMSDHDRARAALAGLRDLGVTISIDDFGTGYSSLAYLRELPVDTLKLDRTFVTSMADDDTAAALVAATVSLAHSLGLQMVAEGVETGEVAAELSRYGCDQAQGYFYARPMDAEAFLAWFAGLVDTAAGVWGGDDELEVRALGPVPLAAPAGGRPGPVS